MNAPRRERRLFWPAATTAAAVALAVSVQAGKLIGEELLRHGFGTPTGVSAVTAQVPPEVLGGQQHAVAVPGAGRPIWQKP